MQSENRRRRGLRGPRNQKTGAAADFDLQHGLVGHPSRQLYTHAQELLVAHPADAEAVVRRTQSVPLKREEQL